MQRSPKGFRSLSAKVSYILDIYFLRWSRKNPFSVSNKGNRRCLQDCKHHERATHLIVKAIIEDKKRNIYLCTNLGLNLFMFLMIGLTHCKLTAGDCDSRQKAKAVQANKLNIAKQEFHSKTLWFILPPSCSLFRFCCQSFRLQPRHRIS